MGIKQKNLPTIIGIGTSAGGLEALKSFFDHVPNNSSYTYVVVQHLAPDYKSLMKELLAKDTELPIQQAEDNMIIQPGNIYLIPPNKNMTISEMRLNISTKEVKRFNSDELPINIFFKSLSLESEINKVGIILSGTGSDGAHGIIDIKSSGGFTIAQEPSQSKFNGMPISAVNTGMIDLVVNVEEMINEIERELEYPRNNKILDNIKKDVRSFKSLLNLINSLTDFDFSKYKTPTLFRRIASKIEENNFDSLDDYVNYLHHNAEQIHLLPNDFFINVTNFFRDSDLWDSFSKNAVEKIIKSKDNNSTIKIWSVGCSTGEEVYSLAILVDELIQKHQKELNVKIFATDINIKNINIASKGEYKKEKLSGLSKERINRYFIPKDENSYQIQPNIRANIIYSQHDILKSPPFNRMDLVICRNLLIYFKPEAQKRVLAILHFALNVGGHLLLGKSESINELESSFIEIDRKAKIFEKLKKKSFGNYRSDIETFPYQNTISSRSTNYDKMTLKPFSESQVSNITSDVFNSELKIAGIITDTNLNILNGVGDLSQYIVILKNGFSSNLKDIFPEKLVRTITLSIRRLRNNELQRVRHNNIIYENANGTQKVDIVTKTQFSGDNKTIESYLILLLPSVIEFENTPNYEINNFILDSEETKELEEELGKVKNVLKSTIEESETTNEELQASNEELLSSNEELQSANEELQSLNEELHTVNAEYQQKIEDLALANDDINNLITGSNIASIFLDKELKIRRFTSSIVNQINLISEDIGRPFIHFSNQLTSKDYSILVNDINKAIKEKYVKERQVQGQYGIWYQQLVRSFINARGEIDGVHITYINIDEIIQMQNQIGASKRKYETLFNIAPDVFFTIDLKSGNIVDCNKSFLTELNIDTIENAIGSSIYDYYLVSDVEKIKKIHTQLIKDKEIRSKELIIVDNNGNQKNTLLNATYISGEELINDLDDGLILCCWQNITTIVKQRKEINKQNIVLKQVLEGVNAGYWDWYIKKDEKYLSLSFKSMFGYTENEIENTTQAWQKLLYTDDIEKVQTVFEKHVISKGEFPYYNEVRYRHKNGTLLWMLRTGSVIEWDEKDGSPLRMVGCDINITKLKEMQNNLISKNKDLEHFAYIASHDLKSPISNISSLIELLKEKETVDGEFKELFVMIQKSTAKMTSTISLLNEILDIKKSLHIPCELVDPNILIEEVIENLKQDIIGNNVEIKYHFEKVLLFPKVFFNLIFQNLITNSIKYKKQNSPPIVSIRHSENEDYDIITYTDNGRGIDMEKYGSKIFNIFQRFHLEIDGKGIGLYLIKTTLENYKGKIELESEVNQGVVFKLYFQKNINFELD